MCNYTFDVIAIRHCASSNNLSFNTVTVIAGLPAVAALSLHVKSIYVKVSACSTVIASSLVPEGAMWVGKGKGYNCACTANAMPSQT